mmetsp:Transcript_16417/g.45303  ORF Transcript_16417/g.45303 Transcript_16417/m.45303 type:complete len:593 (-) Transcript_16417:1203-2981(-)|eukprot:CAMPEP_0172363114 /NCGR_PEP_ID=MMETSP1060-20121228/6558_1 /TAXON_ID=37318 /ORGANISM="Pseudo-nitzschia pungens, Strain cf. cingulata" /LENGTH=592 /DNA_ID=CAMNT_0013085783 /DNA_START=114 /DNA_END=1892 /DNA_ORIENTATION=+
MVKVSPAVLFLLCSQLRVGTLSGFVPANKGAATTAPTATSSTTLGFNWFGLGRNKGGGGGGDGDETTTTTEEVFGLGGPSITITNTQQKDYVGVDDDWLGNNLPSFGTKGGRTNENLESADVVVIGGGVSGLAAAITAAEAAGETETETKKKIVLLEANTNCGGRVNSVTTDDGFVLDEGFAVFIEEYPAVKKLLDYDGLELKRFLPGALVKIRGSDKLARVADPLRNPEDIFESVLSPIGSLVDKIKVLPLVLNVRLSSVGSIFDEAETDTKTALVERWGFSDDFIDSFLKPFLEGIYLAPLPEQSSRMFSFVFKMFSDGSATLPKGGMVAVSNQLVKKAESLGVTVLTETPITRVVSKQTGGEDGSRYVVECAGAKKRSFAASSVVVATDGKIAKKIIGNLEGFESLKDEPDQTQRAVGCLYYGFEGPAPVEDPILVLNGMKDENDDDPVNNVCFPSVVNDGYAPEGYNLCSVTILSDAMNRYMDKPEELDQAVRRQLGTWFVDQESDILDKWDLKKIFYIPKAQPAQYNGPQPASFNGSRSSTTFYGKELPSGLYVCGDHMATATLNGAVESGVLAGSDVAKAILPESA